MRELKARTKVVVEVNGGELENFIEEVYGQSIELVADQECGNHCITRNVSKGSLSTDLSAFIKTGKYGYIMNDLLTDMANRNLIPEGDYVIDVTW